MLAKRFRIRKNKDYRLVYRQGKTVVNKNLVLYFVKAEGERAQAGFVVSKRIGKAVVRNRVRRVLREAYRRWQPEVRGGKLVFLARKPIIGADFGEVVAAVGDVLRRAKIFHREGAEAGVDSG